MKPLNPNRRFHCTICNLIIELANVRLDFLDPSTGWHTVQAQKPDGGIKETSHIVHLLGGDDLYA